MIGDTAAEMPENLAQHVRQQFIAKKSVQLGKPYRPGNRHDNKEVWLKAATACIELGFSVEDFIEMLFTQNTVHGGPYPPQMGGPKIRQWAKAYREVYAADFAKGNTVADHELELDVIEISRFIKIEKEHGGVPLAVIRGAIYPFKAYVRILMSPDEGTIEMFRDQAIQELCVNPPMREALKKRGLDVDKILPR